VAQNGSGGGGRGSTRTARYDAFAAEVVSVAPLSPNLLRLVLGGGDLADYPPIGVPDESVALYLPVGGETVVRNYTVRAIDAGRLTVDVVRHEGGAAAGWAATACPGDRLRLSRPRAWYRPPAGTGWQVLAADLTGLPALARILEEGPAGTAAGIATEVLVEVLDEGDLAALPHVPGLAIDAVVGAGNGVAPSVLAERVCSRSRSGAGYVWFAGEAGESRRIRKQVRGQWGWPSDRLDAIGYWRRDGERWTARYRAVADHIDGIYQAALDEGHCAKEAAEILDDAYEQAGL
jgi:NADPH-dependent ferric siderophore reductase